MQKRITLLLLTAAFSAQASKPLPFINGMQVTPPALAQWNGELVFDPAWCLQFPDAAAAGSLTTGLLNDGSVALARVEYAPQLRSAHACPPVAISTANTNGNWPLPGKDRPRWAG